MNSQPNNSSETTLSAERLAKQKAGRRTFLLINFMFFGPLAVAMFLYFSGMNWRPEGSTEHGQLLLPPQTIPNIILREATDSNPKKQLRGVWTLVYAGPGECPEICKQRLTELRQMRLGFGKDMKRLQNVFLSTSGSVDKSYMTVELPQLFAIDTEAASESVSVIENPLPGEVYVVDPQGNLMMRFNGDESIENIKKDLKKLLKLSQIG